MDIYPGRVVASTNTGKTIFTHLRYKGKKVNKTWIKQKGKWEEVVR